jgi:hypothetical protein
LHVEVEDFDDSWLNVSWNFEHFLQPVVVADFERLVIILALDKIESWLVYRPFFNMVNDLAFKLVKLSLESVAVLLLELELLLLVCEHNCLEVSRNLDKDLRRWRVSEIKAHFRSQIGVDLSGTDQISRLFIRFDLIVVLKVIIDDDLVDDLPLAGHKALEVVNAC